MGVTILFPIFGQIVTHRPPEAGATRPRTHGRTLLADIVLLAGESTIFDLCALDLTLVEALYYIADRFGVDFALDDQPGPCVRGELKNSTHLRYKITTRRPREDLCLHLANGLTHFGDLADWVGPLPCAFVSQTGLRLTHVRELIGYFSSTDRNSDPIMRRMLHDPDNIAQG